MLGLVGCGACGGHGGWQHMLLPVKGAFRLGAVPVLYSSPLSAAGARSQHLAGYCSRILAIWWLSWAEAVKLQGIIFSLIS